MSNIKNRKYIIWSAIIIILIACVSVSYAYFTANIVGNETANPVYLRSGLLELTYRDGNNINANPVVPSWSQTKIVEIENTGKKSVTYKIILDPLLNEIQNDELVFSATCKQYLVDENNVRTETGTCDDIETQGIPVNTVANPIELPYTLADNINIDKNYLHIYTMKFEFIETPTPQDYNQDKLFNGTINVMESIPWYEELSKYPNRLTSRMLAGGASPTDMGTQVSALSINPKASFMAANSDILQYTIDEEQTQDGSRVYFYHGITEENHVIFANFCWRIVRTNEDGSVRMRYNGTPSSGTCPVKGSQVYASYIKNGNTISGESVIFNHPSYSGNQPNYLNSYTDLQNIKPVVPALDNPQDIRGRVILEINDDENKRAGYMYGSDCISYETCHANEINSYVKNWVEDWYAHTIGANEDYDNKVINSEFCNDRSVVSGTGVGTIGTEYGAYARVNSGLPTYKCAQANDIFKEKVGLLTADETMFAGGTSLSNTSYYLYTGNKYWLMSPSRLYFGRMLIYAVSENGILYNNNTNDSSLAVLPVISLKANIEVSSGLGTSSSPWIVD